MSSYILNFFLDILLFSFTVEKNCYDDCETCYEYMNDNNNMKCITCIDYLIFLFI